MKTKKRNPFQSRSSNSNSKKIRNKTPTSVLSISKDIAKGIRRNRFFSSSDSSSYQPTINDQLASLHSSFERVPLTNCNNDKAFQLLEPLKIDTGHGRCLNYTSKQAKDFLIKNLSANKHIDPSKIVPPIQIDSNCWFNAFFVIFFVSDKGRRFFQFFRQLMIEGKQISGQPIQPPKLRNAFSLLNFAIDSALTGSSFAYTLNTNSIIQQIYEAIPEKSAYLVKVNEASNPLRYYDAIITYLNNQDLKLQLITAKDNDWPNTIVEHLIPHIIIVEIYDGQNQDPGDSGKIHHKPKTITKKYGNQLVKYTLDSCVVRDIDQNHFCAMITCEKKEMAYDGMSFHRLTPMKWKHLVKTDKQWQFEGSNDIDNKPLKWSFKHGYQMLLYYRT
jgi:hypothetical protein